MIKKLILAGICVLALSIISTTADAKKLKPNKKHTIDTIDFIQTDHNFSDNRFIIRFKIGYEEAGKWTNTGSDEIIITGSNYTTLITLIESGTKTLEDIMLEEIQKKYAGTIQ